MPGANNEDLEQAFASLTGAEFAVAVSSGTAALEIAFRCLDLTGKMVLLPANTNYATAEAALRAGCHIILYDAGLYASCEAIKAAWVPGVAAVVVVHIGGYLSPGLPEIVDFCDISGVKLVEDASHAHGARLGGLAAGTFGEVAAFSMFATKVVTTGEGGILTTAKKGSLPPHGATGIKARRPMASAATSSAAHGACRSFMPPWEWRKYLRCRKLCSESPPWLIAMCTAFPILACRCRTTHKPATAGTS